MLYAIGEIILVVLGILIALNINNWNENRKLKEFELDLLASFTEELNHDLRDAEYNKEVLNRVVASSDTILALLNSDQSVDTERIGQLFSDATLYTRFWYSTSAFETMKSKGITIISNDSLRSDLIATYDAEYNFFLQNEKVQIDEVERGVTQIFPSRFEESFSYDLSNPDFQGVLIPLDFESLKTDQEFLYYFKSLRNRNNLLINFQYTRLIQRITDLISRIEEEIVKLKQQ